MGGTPAEAENDQRKKVGKKQGQDAKGKKTENEEINFLRGGKTAGSGTTANSPNEKNGGPEKSEKKVQIGFWNYWRRGGTSDLLEGAAHTELTKDLCSGKVVRKTSKVKTGWGGGKQPNKECRKKQESYSTEGSWGAQKKKKKIRRNPLLLRSRGNSNEPQNHPQKIGNSRLGVKGGATPS